MDHGIGNFQTFSNCISQSLTSYTLGKSTLRNLHEYSAIKTYKKGAHIWTKGRPADFCSLIISGFVEITDTTPEGDEKIFGLFGPQNMIGISALIKKTAYPASAIVASRESTTININLNSALSEFAAPVVNEICYWTQHKLAEHEDILRRKITVLGSGLLCEKLIQMFDHLAQRFSDYKINSKEHLAIPVPLSKTHIAKFVGSRVESVIRELNKWEKKDDLIITPDCTYISARLISKPL